MPKLSSELDPPAVDLAELAAAINAEHEAGEEATRKGLEHFRAAGEALIKAKDQCGGRKFKPWLKKHVKFGRTTAYSYIRLAENWSICSTAEHMRDALRLLTEDAKEECDPKPEPAANDAEPDESASVAEPDGVDQEMPKVIELSDAVHQVWESGVPELIDAMDHSFISIEEAVEILEQPKEEQAKVINELLKDDDDWTELSSYRRERRRKDRRDTIEPIAAAAKKLAALAEEMRKYADENMREVDTAD